jgi:hypothetical protein
MKSPRFGLREPTLRPLFDRGNLRRLWKTKVRDAMRDQFLPDPIDHLDFHQSLSVECQRIETLIISGAYTPGETRRLLQEKSKGLCRQLVIPTVRDALILQCLSDGMYRDIKNKEPTKKAFFEPSDHQFSKSSDLLKKSDYGSYRAWLNFQAEIFKFSKDHDYLVVTDIANYYDGISYVHLRNVISDIAPSVREPVLDMLIYVLSGLLWQPDYTPRIEIGLPQMNLDAPRILAHCFLYELDAYLAQSYGGDFTRFMDDIDIGVDSLAEARDLLRCIDLVLHTRHIRLNSGKTEIFRKDQAIEHFRVRENNLLDSAEALINKKVANGASVQRERNILEKFLLSQWKNGRFDKGNGEKILKRMLGISRKIGAEVDDKILYDIILRRPGARASAFFTISARPLTSSRALLLWTALSDPQLVDNATFVHAAYYLNETIVSQRQGLKLAILGIITSMPEDFFGIYSKIWLLSKYGSRPAILEAVQKYRDLWGGDPWLGRLVGGLYPLFIGSRQEAQFRAVVAQSENPEAQRVYGFHDDLRRDPKAFDKAFHFLKAPNPSKGTGVMHAKFLLLISALANNSVPLAKRAKLVAAHSRVWADVYYRVRASAAYGVAIPPTPIPGPPVP